MFSAAVRTRKNAPVSEKKVLKPWSGSACLRSSVRYPSGCGSSVSAGGSTLTSGMSVTYLDAVLEAVKLDGRPWLARAQLEAIVPSTRCKHSTTARRGGGTATAGYSEPLRMYEGRMVVDGETYLPAGVGYLTASLADYADTSSVYRCGGKRGRRPTTRTMR